MGAELLRAGLYNKTLMCEVNIDGGQQPQKKAAATEIRIVRFRSFGFVFYSQSEQRRKKVTGWLDQTSSNLAAFLDSSTEAPFYNDYKDVKVA